MINIDENKEENIKKSNGKEVIVYRDDVIPLVRLNESLDIEAGKTDKKFVIIVNVGDKTVGLLVDSLHGQQEIVIKPLGKTLKGLDQYIKDNQIDIITLTSYKRNIFARLFNPSIARKMIFHSDTPLLVING